MRAEQFPPMPDELAERWGRFPHWDQDTNYNLHLGFVVEDMRAGNAPIGDLSAVFDHIAEVVEAQAEGRMRELSWRSLISGEDPKPSDLRRLRGPSARGGAGQAGAGSQNVQREGPAPSLPNHPDGRRSARPRPVATAATAATAGRSAKHCRHCGITGGRPD